MNDVTLYDFFEHVTLSKNPTDFGILGQYCLSVGQYRLKIHTTCNATIFFSISSNGISVFDKEESFFDRFRSSRDEERGIEPELLITIIKGRNFNKTLKDPDVAFKECRVKCKLYPDCHHHGPKMRSDYVDCNYKGNTK